MTTATPAPSPASHTLDLSFGLRIRCSMDSLNDKVELTLLHRDRELIRRTFDAGTTHAGFKHEGEHVRADLGLSVNVFTGEVTALGELAVRVGGDWRDVVDLDRPGLIRFAPAVGEVGGSEEVHEPEIPDRRFADTQLCTPAILRIFVDDRERDLADVGRRVKNAMFPDHPPFVFNTVACVGKADERRRGQYTDPDSHWFNLFFGYYQIDAPKANWTRPFAYRSAAEVNSEVVLEEVARLGKSDWNYFSNWMYGVPEEFVATYNDVDLSKMDASQSSPVEIGSRFWHPVRLGRVEVASTYESDAPGAAQLEINTALFDVWRHSFGLPSPRPDRTKSFIGTELTAQVYMSYWEDDEAFHTTIFGGTIPVGGDRDLLDAQLAAVRDVVERSYPTLGFAAA